MFVLIFFLQNLSYDRKNLTVVDISINFYQTHPRKCYKAYSLTYLIIKTFVWTDNSRKILYTDLTL